MNEDETIEHAVVVSSLLDLQRRLRADGADMGEVPPDGPPAEDPERTQDPPASESGSEDLPAAETVAVSEPDLRVVSRPAPSPESTAPGGEAPADRFAPVTQLPTAVAGDDRVAALTQRLGRLEQDLSGVLDSIGTMRSHADQVTADVAGRIDAARDENDAARAESEARAARIVAERLDAVKDRLSGELGAQRRDLAGLLEQRIRDMEAGLRNAIHAAVAGDDVLAVPDDPDDDRDHPGNPRDPGHPGHR